VKRFAGNLRDGITRLSVERRASDPAPRSTYIAPTRGAAMAVTSCTRTAKTRFWCTHDLTNSRSLYRLECRCFCASAGPERHPATCSSCTPVVGTAANWRTIRDCANSIREHHRRIDAQHDLYHARRRRPKHARKSLRRCRQKRIEGRLANRTAAEVPDGFADHPETQEGEVSGVLPTNVFRSRGGKKNPGNRFPCNPDLFNAGVRRGDVGNLGEPRGWKTPQISE